MDKQQFRLGTDHLRAGRLADAEAVFRALLAAAPGDPDVLHLLGLTLHSAGRHDEALALLMRGLPGRTDQPELHNNIGTVLAALDREAEAEPEFRQAVRLRPSYAEAWGNLSKALLSLGRVEQSIAAGREAIGGGPTYVPGYITLGAALRRQGKLEQAIDLLSKARSVAPGSANVFNELAVTFERQGRLPESLAAFRRAVELAPADAAFHSNLLFALHYDPAVTPKQLFAEHGEWARRHAEPLYPSASPSTAPLLNCSTDLFAQKVRIGYVSADFREHTRAAFMEAVIAAHDKAGFEIFCYSDVRRPDETTRRIEAAADVWRKTAGMSDADVADLVHRDRIDILVELTGHMGHGRLLVFARKPAPVQIAYPGYPNTTGLSTIDFLITDEERDPIVCPNTLSADGPGLKLGEEFSAPKAGSADPNHNLNHNPNHRDQGGDQGGGTDAASIPASSDFSQQFYTEKLIRLPVSSQCWRPPEDSPEVGPPPHLLRGHVTFCCLNKLIKITPAMSANWSAILAAVPGSRLMVLTASAGREDAAVRAAFARAGIPSDRLDLVPVIPRRQYFWRYNHADIALDTYPYNGHTTTLDGLWMGVPAVTLAGTTHVSREGLAICRLLGLDDLTARTQAEYEAIAIRLAGDLPRLAELRRTLRDRMKASPLRDEAGLTRRVEAAYSQAWREWCGRGSGLDGDGLGKG